MDVDRIQKINQLAVDLLRQGLASDREDAVRQAERIFKDQGAEEFAYIREKSAEVKKENNHVALPADEIKHILEQNATFLVKKIKEFEEKMASVEKEITTLRSQLSSQMGPTIRELSSRSVEPPTEVKPPRPVSKVAEEAARIHPRSGNYTDQDVSIEKFFYMGSK